MKTLSLNVPAKLPNGDLICPGDVVYVNYWGYQSFSRVWESDEGLIMICGAGPFCFDVEAYHFINQGGELKKVTPKEVYLFCKTHNWSTNKPLSLFK